jgi:hypothetical protein
MLRSLLVPAIILGALAFPFVVPMNQPDQLSQKGSALPEADSPYFNSTNQNSPVGNFSPNTAGNAQRNSLGNNSLGNNSLGNTQLPSQSDVGTASPFRLAAARGRGQSRWDGPAAAQVSSATSPAGAFSSPTGTANARWNGGWAGPIVDELGNVIGMVPGANAAASFGGVNGQVLPAGVPDYAAAQTFSLPGNAVGPDFSASPMQFTPVMDFAEIFNYQVSSKWLQSRWARVSNSPALGGLRGQRVALVTGTNTWDLHGSLTYYFDEYQKCRRITFRGWVGDPTRLVKFLQEKHGFEQQPTGWAGFYLAKNWRKTLGGLLMKNPPVTYVENRVQRVGVLLELNDPKGKFELSEEFASLINGSN